MANSSKPDSFQLKAEFLPITTLQLLRSDMQLLHSQLECITQKAPHYFANAPVIVDFRGLDHDKDTMDVKQVCALLREFQMQPIAARGLKTHDALPVLLESSEKPAKPTTKETKVHKESTKIITKPVRAGTQIYAKESDLIILSSVNAGAEIIADGNIHVYGPLRGRALAGAQGDTQARIFCKDCEAELVSIAGHYWINEKIKSLNIKNQFIQLFLENDELHLEHL